MKRRLLLAALATLLAAGPAAAAPRHDALPLHAGSHGQRVADAQWLLAGHRPNVFTKVRPTFKWKPNGAYGARTKAAVKAYKFRLGYPAKGQCGARVSRVTDTAGALFFEILTGKAKRPACWIAVAAGRVKAVEPGASRTALDVKTYEISQLGVAEQPLGSNDGAAVRMYQSATGAFRAAWCVSFQQWSFGHVGYGHFADDTAAVYYAVDYYAARNLVFAKPKVGALVAFVDYDSAGRRIPGTGHMGFVAKVTATGFVSIEGNASNRVLERFHQLGDRGSVFIRLPGVA